MRRIVTQRGLADRALDEIRPRRSPPHCETSHSETAYAQQVQLGPKAKRRLGLAAYVSLATPGALQT